MDLTPEQQGMIQSMLMEMAATLTFQGWQIIWHDYHNGRYAPSSADSPTPIARQAS